MPSAIYSGCAPTGELHGLDPLTGSLLLREHLEEVRKGTLAGCGGRRARRRHWTLEVVVLPVSDIDRAREFYRDKVGFHLDHDTRNEHMHVVQLTPNGSGCSIVFGDLPSQREMEPGSRRRVTSSR